jgi:hypothetical protein
MVDKEESFSVVSAQKLTEEKLYLASLILTNLFQGL